MERQKIVFSSVEYKQPFSLGKKARVLYTMRMRTPSQYKTKRRSDRQDTVEAGSMLCKLGLCASACALMMLVNAQQAEYTDTGDVYADEQTTDQDVEDMGKLRFVQMPGLLSVFSVNRSFELPLNYRSFTLSQDDAFLTLVSAQNQDLTAWAACQVTTIDKDKTLGHYVCLQTQDGREWQCYGLHEIYVELGQRIVEKDSIGSVKKDADVGFRVLENGDPINISTVFNLESLL